MSDPYAEVIGNPVGHSKSPLIHKFWLEKLGIAGDYRHRLVTADELGPYLARCRHDPDWRGCNLTLPHKSAVLDQVEELTAEAQAIGAVNCVTPSRGSGPKLIGHNSDWLGFLEPLRDRLPSQPSERIAYVVGAGGAAAAICYALDQAGFTIFNVNRSKEKALALRKRVDLPDDGGVIELSDFQSGEVQAASSPKGGERLELLVNATPLGMSGFSPLDVDPARFPSSALVYDTIYSPLETELLRAARARGMATIGGLDMLIGQAAAAFELFFHEPAPREHDLELRARLTR